MGRGRLEKTFPVARFSVHICIKDNTWFYISALASGTCNNFHDLIEFVWHKIMSEDGAYNECFASGEVYICEKWVCDSDFSSFNGSIITFSGSSSD